MHSNYLSRSYRLFQRNARLPTEKAPDLGDVGLPLFRLASGSGF